jgi:rhodanese-related sulfurtransferase
MKGSAMDIVLEISHADLVAAILGGSARIIDCNGTASFEAGHLPTAIDLESASDLLAHLLPADKSELIVVYCGGSTCTAYHKGADRVRALGHVNIRRYAAGITGWKTAHLVSDCVPT